MDIPTYSPTEAATFVARFMEIGYTFLTVPDERDGSIIHAGTLLNVDFDQCPNCYYLQPAKEEAKREPREHCPGCMTVLYQILPPNSLVPIRFKTVHARETGYEQVLVRIHDWDEKDGKLHLHPHGYNIAVDVVPDMDATRYMNLHQSEWTTEFRKGTLTICPGRYVPPGHEQFDDNQIEVMQMTKHNYTNRVMLWEGKVYEPDSTDFPVLRKVNILQRTR